MKAFIVVDLGFGDSGKGITTDFLASKYKDSIVVRFSGGQQASHAVIINGKKHVHSSFGSGTLRGRPSYFSEHTSLYLPVLAEELRVLRHKGINPKLYVHPQTKVTTPSDVAYNRVLEQYRQHGSVGLGIAATMKRYNETGYKLTALDLKHPAVFLAKMTNIKDFYVELCREQGLSVIAFLKEHDILRTIFNQSFEIELPFSIQDYDYLRDYEYLIMEGSQGILLDMDHGFFPNVTYGNVTSKNAFHVLRQGLPILDTELFYVTRCYQNRHGNGWMSNTEYVPLINNRDEINVYNEWQGNLRTGELDYSLLNYALDVDKLYSYDLPKSLVVTCLDQRPGFKMDYTKFNTEFKAVYNSYSPESKDFKEVELPQRERSHLQVLLNRQKV